MYVDGSRPRDDSFWCQVLDHNKSTHVVATTSERSKTFCSGSGSTHCVRFVILGRRHSLRYTTQYSKNCLLMLPGRPGLSGQRSGPLIVGRLGPPHDIWLRTLPCRNLT